MFCNFVTDSDLPNSNNEVNNANSVKSNVSKRKVEENRNYREVNENKNQSISKNSNIGSDNHKPNDKNDQINKNATENNYHIGSPKAIASINNNVNQPITNKYTSNTNINKDNHSIISKPNTQPLTHTIDNTKQLNSNNLENISNHANTSNNEKPNNILPNINTITTTTVVSTKPNIQKPNNDIITTSKSFNSINPSINHSLPSPPPPSPSQTNPVTKTITNTIKATKAANSVNTVTSASTVNTELEESVQKVLDEAEIIIRENIHTKEICNKCIDLSELIDQLTQEVLKLKQSVKIVMKGIPTNQLFLSKFSFWIVKLNLLRADIYKINDLIDKLKASKCPEQELISKRILMLSTAADNLVSGIQKSVSQQKLDLNVVVLG